MKDFTLEDMTKPELIKIIKQSQAYQPTQKVMRWVRWESMCELITTWACLMISLTRSFG